MYFPLHYFSLHKTPDSSMSPPTDPPPSPTDHPDPDPATRAAKGQRTLLTTLFRRAEVTPHLTFGSFALSPNLEEGFRDFTFAELAKAVDACAWYIKKSFGVTKDFESLFYAGTESDYRTFVCL